MAQIQNITIKTIYLPGGTNGIIFILVATGQYLKCQRNNGSDGFDFFKSSEAEVNAYRARSENVWWDSEAETWKKYDGEQKCFLWWDEAAQEWVEPEEAK